MKIRFLFLIPSILLLTSCSGWFQPLPPHDHWRLHNSKILFPTSDPQRINKYLGRREKDMSDCDMDFVIGESDNPEVNLCLEKKGWYLEGGPICEEKTMWNRPACIQWRKKHSKPDAKPWQ